MRRLTRNAAFFLALAAGVLFGTSLGAIVPLGVAESQTSTAPFENQLLGLENPFVDGVEYPNMDEASEQVSFAPVVAPSLGAPGSIFVRSVNDPSQRSLGLVYQHPVFGRFVVLEEPTRMTQANLEALAATCIPETGCDGWRAIVVLADQSRALQAVTSASSAVMWLRDGMRLSVYGPVETLSPDDLDVIANAMALE